MPLEEVITSTVTTGAAPLGLASLNIPMVPAILTTPQGTAWDTIYGGSVLVASVGPSTWAAALLALGVLATEDLHLALTDMFSQRATDGQQLAPEEVLLGRRATPVAQVETVTIDAYEAGTYTVDLTYLGVLYEFDVPGNTDEPTTAVDIRAAIPAATGLPVTSSGAGNDIVLTADDAGVPFLITVTHSATPANISVVATTANVGIGEDIALWRAEDGGDRWYFLMETSGNLGVQGTAANAIESIVPNRIGRFQTDEVTAFDGGDSTDLGSLLGPTGQSLTRSTLVYGSNPNDFVSFASVGKACGLLPGQAGWEHQSLASVTGSVFTAAQTTALGDKFYTWLEQYEAASKTSTRGGKMLDGQWIDIRWLIDDLIQRTQVRVYEALLDKNIPYIGGEDVVEMAIRNALAERSDALDLASIDVTVPRASTQSAADSLARRMAGVVWRADALGKVSLVVIQGYLDQ